MKNNKQLTYLVIFLSVFLVAIVGATYAYFESATDLEGAEFNVQAVTAGSTSFTGYSTGNIEFNVAFSQMSQTNVSDSIVATDNAQVSISLESENENVATTCTYDLVWVWDGADKYTEADTELPYLDEQLLIDMGISNQLLNMYKQVIISMFGEANWKEGLVLVFKGEAAASGEYMPPLLYKHEMSVQVDNGDEIDLSSLTWNGNEAIITKKSITSMGGVKENHEYDVKVNMYNIPVVQNNLYGKDFNAHIEVRNSNCISEELSEPTIASTYITSKYTTQGENGMCLHDSSLEGGANDGSYRFAGGNPDNYVCFEGDDCLEANNQYRIIGVFDNKVKLIKSTAIAYMPWDLKENDATNDWEESTLNAYLNSNDESYEYYTYSAGNINQQTIEGYLHTLEDKVNLIADTVWSVGGTYNTDYKKNFRGFYDVELDSSTTYISKIGLMYVTDYLYSALPSQYATTVNNYSYEEQDTENWMKQRLVDWTISRYSDRSAYAFDVIGGHVNNGYVACGGGVRPAFYLTPSVKIKKGTGTATNPYIIAL